VKSPVVSTAVQVFSRILVLFFINIFLRDQPLLVATSTGILIVSIAWGVTELARYSLYFLQLFGKQPRFLLWIRYSFFVVLYPLGVTGEWAILLAPILREGITLNTYTVFLAVAAVAYIFYFPVLYKYMWKQRELKLT
jgi:very-long-chain (3R)-3-hydroxyacyl-CoA dehydratase